MIGWIGSILLALCGFPQAVKSIMDGHSDGVSLCFIIMWTLGEILTLIYVFNEVWSGPLLVNYLLNCMFCSVILYYKIYPNKPGTEEGALDRISDNWSNK